LFVAAEVVGEVVVMMVVGEFLNLMTVGAYCVVVAVVVVCIITGDIAIDWSDFVDESELFQYLHRSVDGGDIDSIVTDFCDIVGIEWFGRWCQDIDDDLAWFGDFMSMVGECGLCCGLERHGFNR
jgi:hypothetical protein